MFLFLFCVIVHTPGNLALAKENIEYRTYSFVELLQFSNDSNQNYFDSSDEELADLYAYTTKDDTFYRDINIFLRSPSKKNYV